jgi:hypothetical protein
MSDLERIALIRRRMPGLMHQWYGEDVPFLLAALDEANTDRLKWEHRAHTAGFETTQLRAERDRAVAQVQRALELHSRFVDQEGTGCTECGGWDWPCRTVAALAGEGSEQLPAKPNERAEATLRKVCEACRACETCVLRMT